MPKIFDSSVDAPKKKKLTAEPMANKKNLATKRTNTEDEPHSESKRGETHVRHRHIDDYSETMRNERPATSSFAAYMPKPEKIRFSNQGTSEKVILLLRQHPVTQLTWVFSAIILGFVPVLFGSVPVFRDILPLNFQLVALVGWYLLITGYLLESFLKWFYNVYIITDERIIDVDFHSLIYKNVSAAKIDNIEDTTASAGGFFAALFDYGKITIQTAAEKREFEFDKVPHPTKVTNLINELILEEEREKIEGRVS